MTGNTPSASLPRASTRGTDCQRLIHEKIKKVDEGKLTEGGDREIDTLSSFASRTFVRHSGYDRLASGRSSDSKFRSTFRGVVHGSLDRDDVIAIGRDGSTSSRRSRSATILRR